MTLAAFETRGDDLVVSVASPELADHLWQQRSELVRRAESQRLRLVVDLADGPLELTWAPSPLPPTLFLSRRRRR